MSIRLRLTLLHSVILTVTLIGFSVASYLTVARDGYNRLVATLESKAQRIVMDDQFQLDDIEALAHQFAGPEIYVQTRDAAGIIVDRSPNLAGNSLPLGETAVANLTSGTAWVETTIIGAERRLVYNLPLATETADGTLLQISNALTDRDNSLDNLVRVLLVGNVLVIAAAFGIGWRLADFGLRPIFRLSQGVLAIGHSRDFAKRVNYAGADDEIGQLAFTFDQMLDELEDAHLQTEQTLQTQRRFVADASHELRTPLTTIRDNLTLLCRQPPINDSDRMAVLTDLVDETDRLIRLVNDLLVLARADVQPPQWQEPIHLRPLLDTVERQMKQLAPNRNVCVEPVPNGISSSVTPLGNEDALKQVLLILLDNAIKHTPPSAQISVHTAAANTRVEICVSDTGPGIPKKFLPLIFDRFYVVDAARTQNSTGLGLAIAKSLVESQNGQLTVTSSARSGTTFKVTLSCQKQP